MDGPEGRVSGVRTAIGRERAPTAGCSLICPKSQPNARGTEMCNIRMRYYSVCRRAMLYKATGQRQTGWIVVLAMLCSSTNDPAVCYVASGGGGNTSGYNLVHPNVSYANSGGCGSAAQHHHDYGYPRAEVTNSFVQDLDCSIHSSAVAAVAAAAAAAAAISNYHHQHGPNPVSSSAIHPAGTAGGGSNIKKFWEHPTHPAGPQAKKSDAAAAAAAKSSQNNR